MNYLRRHLRDIPADHRAYALEFLAQVLEGYDTPTFGCHGFICADADQIARDAQALKQEEKNK